MCCMAMTGRLECRQVRVNEERLNNNPMQLSHNDLADIINESK